MTNHYTLKILQNFECLMSECPDNCCFRDWDLPVDKTTKVKWNNLTDIALQSKLLDSVLVQNKNGQAVEFLKHQKDNRCVHVSDNGLCSIHASYGHEILPETCQNYPREKIVNDTVTVSSAHMSCPEIVQQLMRFESSDSLFEHSNNTQTQSVSISSALEKTSLDIISQQAYPVAQRLYLIANIIEQLKQQSTVAPLDENRIIKTATLSSNQIANHFNALQKKITKNKLKINKKVSGLYWQFVYSSCRAISDPEIEGRVKGSNSLKQLQTFSCAENIDEHSLQLKYYNLLSQLNSALPTTISNTIDTILTRYMVVKFKNHGYPWFLYKNNVILTFLDCVIPFSQINMLLWLIYENHQVITENDILTVIYKVERSTAHNTKILTDIENNVEFSELLLYAGSWIKA